MTNLEPELDQLILIRPNSAAFDVIPLPPEQLVNASNVDRGDEGNGREAGRRRLVLQVVALVHRGTHHHLALFGDHSLLVFRTPLIHVALHERLDFIGVVFLHHARHFTQLVKPAHDRRAHAVLTRRVDRHTLPERTRQQVEQSAKERRLKPVVSLGVEARNVLVRHRPLLNSGDRRNQQSTQQSRAQRLLTRCDRHAVQHGIDARRTVPLAGTEEAGNRVVRSGTGNVEHEIVNSLTFQANLGAFVQYPGASAMLVRFDQRAAISP
ncbi:Uncharacterised protein [Citrobacter werkmanii]|nr:Uncharacterised protein [Citrobacter werkmanii]